MTTQLASARPTQILAASLVLGFAASVAVWFAWFLCHYAPLGIPTQAGVLIPIAVWFAAMVAGGRHVSPGIRTKVGLSAGLISASLGLLLVGSRLAPNAGNLGGANPSIPVVTLGFLIQGVALGGSGVQLGSRMLGGRPGWDRSQEWLARFGIVAIGAALALIVVGGLVTSTNSGMAVVDWPQTFGANMFLFPLRGVAPNVFLEHSHRLFGTLLGLTALVLMVWVLRAETRGWVKGWSVALFAGICVQGVLGGFRVLENSPWMGAIHGILAQVIFAGLAALAVFLWVTPERLAAMQGFAGLCRIKLFSTAALHTTLLQLVFGALYRHLRGNHALFAHVGFGFVVLMAGLLGAFVASTTPRESGAVGRALRACGIWVGVVVVVQFSLGWVTLVAGGRDRDPASALQAVLRTIHQADGALLVGLTTALAVLARLMFKQMNRREGGNRKGAERAPVEAGDDAGVSVQVAVR